MDYGWVKAGTAAGALLLAIGGLVWRLTSLLQCFVPKDSCEAHRAVLAEADQARDSELALLRDDIKSLQTETKINSTHLVWVRETLTEMREDFRQL